MSKNIQSLVHALIVAVVFFLLAIGLQFVSDLYQSNWDFTSQALAVKEYTFMIPLLVFAFEFILSLATNKINDTVQEVSDIVQNVPDEVQKRTRKEIDRLKDDNEKFRKQLAKGVVEHNQHYYRTLTYKNEEGSLFNGFGDAKDITRNVLFSNQTINLIFRKMRDTDLSNQNLLHDIGKSASERFAAEMVRDIQKQYSSKNIELTDWLLQWIEFDSDAGFGKFELEGDLNNWKEKKVILLKHSFLTEDCLDMESRKKNYGLCKFMTGYLEGIISSFPHDVLTPYDLVHGKVSVTHDTSSEKECICAKRPVHEGCRFHLSS